MVQEYELVYEPTRYILAFCHSHRYNKWMLDITNSAVVITLRKRLAVLAKTEP